MKRLYVYVDASVIGGCEDSEFAKRALRSGGLIEIRTPREVLADEDVL